MSDETAPWIWLRGERAGLGPIREDLLETYWRLEQQIPTIVGYNRQSPQPMRTTRAILIDGGSGDEIRFTIYDLTQEPAAPVGLAKLAMDTARGNAEYIEYEAKVLDIDVARVVRLIEHDPRSAVSMRDQALRELNRLPGLEDKKETRACWSRSRRQAIARVEGRGPTRG